MTKWMRAAALALLIPALGACEDDPEGPDDAGDEIGSVRLTIGTQTITMNSGGTVTGGPITLVAGVATPVTAVFLSPTNQSITLSNEFRLDVTPDNSGRLTFTRTGSFAGSLTGNSAGAANASVAVFHIGEGHNDWGSSAHTFSVTVQ